MIKYRDRLSIDAVTTGGVIFLTVAAFVLSYDNLRQLAIIAGFNWWLSWLYPLCFDAIMIIAAMTTLRATIKSDSPRYAGAMVIGFTILSIAGNVLHLPTKQEWYVNGVEPWLPYAVFSVPPVALALSFHLFVVSIKNDIKRGIVKQPLEDVKTVSQDIKPVTEDVPPAPPVTKQVVKPVQVSDKPSIARLMRSDGKPVSLIAAELDVTPKTVYRWTDNGNGNK